MENSSEISLQDSKFTKVLWRLIVTIGIIFTATNIYREGNSFDDAFHADHVVDQSKF